MPVPDRRPLLSSALLLPAALMALAVLLQCLAELTRGIGPLLGAMAEGLDDSQPLLVAMLIATLRAPTAAPIQGLNGLLSFLLLDSILGSLLPDLPPAPLLYALAAGWLSARSYPALARVRLPAMLHSYQGTAIILLGNSLLTMLLSLPLAGALLLLHGFLMVIIPIGLAYPLGNLLLTIAHQPLAASGLYPALGSELTRLAAEQFAGSLSVADYLAWLHALNLFALPGVALALIWLAPHDRRRPLKGLLLLLMLANWLGMSPQPLAFALLCFAPRLFMLLALLAGVLISCSLCLDIGFPLHAAAEGALRFWPDMVNALLPGSALLLLHALAALHLSLLLGLKPRIWRELDTPLLPCSNPYQSTDPTLRAIYYTKALGGFGNLLSLSSNLTGLIVELDDPRQLQRDRLRELGVISIQPLDSCRLQLLMGPVAESLEIKIRQLAARQSQDLQPRGPELRPFSFS